MFTADNDGKVCVALGKNRVTVPMPTDAEIALMASTTETGLWANVYEKAVGQHRFNPEKADERPTALSVVAVGGSAGKPVENEEAGSIGPQLEHRALIGCASVQGRSVEISRAVENQTRIRVLPIRGPDGKAVKNRENRSVRPDLEDGAQVV